MFGHRFHQLIDHLQIRPSPLYWPWHQWIRLHFSVTKALVQTPPYQYVFPLTFVILSRCLVLLELINILIRCFQGLISLLAAVDALSRLEGLDDLNKQVCLRNLDLHNSELCDSFLTGRDWITQHNRSLSFSFFAPSFQFFFSFEIDYPSEQLYL